MFSNLMYRLQALFRRNSMEAELDKELRAHVEQQAEKYIQAGMSPEDAARRARLEFGGVEQVKEECRDSWGVRLVSELGHDLRYGLRQLRRNPGFTAVAVLTLALGIGANTAIFSLIDAVMLRPLPVGNPQQLVLLGWNSEQTPHELTQSGHGGEVSYPVFEQLSNVQNIFSAIFGFASCGTVNVTADGQANLARAEMVTGTYFSGLGVQPIYGRAITSADERAGTARVAVISYRYWMRQFGGSPDALGKAFTLNRVPFSIIGVAPPEFMGVLRGEEPDLWVPVREPEAIMPWGVHASNHSPLTAADWWWLDVMARLKPGVSRAQARARIDPVLRQGFAASLNRLPTSRETPHAEINSASHGLNALKQRYQEPLWTLMAIVGLVLLIACANIAGLLLARGTARRREMAMRQALGASRLRLLRQLLAESFMLAGTGAIVGAIFAWWGCRALLFLVSSGRQRVILDLRPDFTILVFTAGAAILAGLLFGMMPALQTTGVGLKPVVEGGLGANSPVAHGGRLSVGKVLVVAQVAVALVLLIGAGLLVRTLQKLEGQNLGFNEHRLLTFGIDPARDGYQGERLTHLYGQLSQNIRTLPGVRSASLSWLGLITDWYNSSDFEIEGLNGNSGQRMRVYWNAVGPDFFKTMEIPFLIGRGIEEGDTERAPKVIVINQSMADKYFNGKNPIGRRLRFPRFPDPKVEYEIVGVVGDAKYWSMRQAIAPTAYFAYNQMEWMLKMSGTMHYEIRTAADPSPLADAVRHVVRNLDPNLPLFGVKTQDEQIDESLMIERLLAEGSGFFSVVALLLACVGLYGLLAYTVSRRTHEIGIRMALGAEKGDVLKMVVGQGLKLALAGVAIGIAGALALTRFLASLLYGVKPTDPVTFVAVSVILIALALAACYIPARRASKLDPMVALRYE